MYNRESGKKFYHQATTLTLTLHPLGSCTLRRWGSLTACSWLWRSSDYISLSSPKHFRLNKMTSEKQSNTLEQFLILAKSAKGAAAVALIKQALETPNLYVFGELLDRPNIDRVSKWSNRLNKILKTPVLRVRVSGYSSTTPTDCEWLTDCSCCRV